MGEAVPIVIGVAWFIVMICVLASSLGYKD
jgi:hypothetical protein